MSRMLSSSEAERSPVSAVIAFVASFQTLLRSRLAGATLQWGNEDAG